MPLLDEIGKATAETVLPIVRRIEAVYLGEGLEKIYKRDKAKHKKLLITGKLWLEELMVEAKKTKTPFDDTGIGGILDAISISAEKHKIKLS